MIANELRQSIKRMLWAQMRTLANTAVTLVSVSCGSLSAYAVLAELLLAGVPWQLIPLKLNCYCQQH